MAAHSRCIWAGDGAGGSPRAEPSRPCQQPRGKLKLSRALLLVSVSVVCLLLTAPAHLFSGCRFLVLKTPFWVVGKGRGEDALNDLISDQVGVL